MKKVFVGLSGGVDSAVSAALLQEQGYVVTGVFIKIWQPEFIECTWQQDRLDAMRVCAALNIPFREVDFSHEYKRDVVDPMIADYQSGITPNPDVLCNRYIKFGAFLTWAISEGADLIATGHYARVRQGADVPSLLRAADTAKDQSYFLYRMSEADLARTIFPIGEMQKKEVRAEASRKSLPVAHKPDSQGLCFVGHVSMSDFLARFIPLSPGPVLLEDTVVGEHHGAALYTIGQRHGFTIAKNVVGSQHYVTRVDVTTNTVHVSARRDDAARASVTIRDIHWIGQAPGLPRVVEAQSRYHEKPVSGTLSQSGKNMRVEFNSPHIASPGQSLVMYEGDTCLGGGILI